MTDRSLLPMPTTAFSRIFVVSDGERLSTGALDAVMRLAARGHMPVEVLAVESPRMPDARTRDELERLCERVGLRPEITVLHSDDVAEAVDERIHSWTRHEVADGRIPRPLLCLATHARGPILGIVLGSVSEQIVRRTHHPMLLIGPRARAFTSFSERLLVCVDPTTLSDPIVEAARSWVRSFGGTVHLFCVTAPGADDRDPRRRLRVGREWFEEHAIVCRVEVFEASSVASAIVDAAKRFGMSAVAMTTQGAGPLQRLHEGSTALDVVADAARPVLLLNPRHRLDLDVVSEGL